MESCRSGNEKYTAPGISRCGHHFIIVSDDDRGYRLFHSCETQFKRILDLAVIALLVITANLYPTITLTHMPDGSPVGVGFTVLTLPMHLISDVLAVWGIRRFSK